MFTTIIKSLCIFIVIIVYTFIICYISYNIGRKRGFSEGSRFHRSKITKNNDRYRTEKGHTRKSKYEAETVRLLPPRSERSGLR